MGFPRPPFISLSLLPLHYPALTLLTPRPSSHSCLTFHLHSLSSPLSSGCCCREVSLSLMTVGLMPARPPLCPQPAQLSRGTKGRGSGEVSQTDPLRQNKPQKHFKQCSLRGWGEAFEVQSNSNTSHYFYLMVATGQKTIQ